MKRWHDTEDCKCHLRYEVKLISKDEDKTEWIRKYHSDAPEHLHACLCEADAQDYFRVCSGYAEEHGTWSFAQAHGMTMDEAFAFFNPEPKP